MAVPKQKQSHARTNKRRSTHKISSPAVNACPQCHQPRRPHRVCPHCGSYGGREVVDVTEAIYEPSIGQDPFDELGARGLPPEPLVEDVFKDIRLGIDT